jgi:hypothetical protein
MKLFTSPVALVTASNPVTSAAGIPELPLCDDLP